MVFDFIRITVVFVKRSVHAFKKNLLKALVVIVDSFCEFIIDQYALRELLESLLVFLLVRLSFFVLFSIFLVQLGGVY
jgi:hypothetical protein